VPSQEWRDNGRTCIGKSRRRRKAAPVPEPERERSESGPVGTVLIRAASADERRRRNTAEADASAAAAAARSASRELKSIAGELRARGAMAAMREKLEARIDALERDLEEQSQAVSSRTVPVPVCTAVLGGLAALWPHTMYNMYTCIY
jgi:hypothetical protein